MDTEAITHCIRLLECLRDRDLLPSDRNKLLLALAQVVHDSLIIAGLELQAARLN